MNNPFDYIPDAACDEAFAKLIARLETLKECGSQADIVFCRELEAGKMLGVLIAADSDGKRHTLYAFSGQLGNGGFHHDGFVGPVFDYLQPDGYFKTKEKEICCLTEEIKQFEEGTYAQVMNAHRQAEDIVGAKVSEYKEKCSRSKEERAVRRREGAADGAELAAMIRQSQFEKAELHRLKKKLASELVPFANSLKDAKAHLDALKEIRRIESENLQEWLFSNFKLLNANGEERSVLDIFSDTPMKTPPSGAGECCAPKLLQAAYRQGLRPMAMAEYWYGKPTQGEVRIHGQHYPACRGKCLPALSWMLQGLATEPPLDSRRQSCLPRTPEILFENQWFCVVNKPSGMLSVPGRGAALSVEQWLADKYGADRRVKMAHRLDQDTSGVAIATFGDLPLKVMQTLFAMRKIRKIYVAELEGDYAARGIPRKGQIELPLSPDYLDRPRQRIDLVGGKPAVTDYEFTGSSGGRSRVAFHPLTGRTHQLRVHSASDMGLGMPIAGDRLYGKNRGGGEGRMLLHAHRLEFTFPIDKKSYIFESPVPF